MSDCNSALFLLQERRITQFPNVNISYQHVLNRIRHDCIGTIMVVYRVRHHVCWSDHFCWRSHTANDKVFQKTISTGMI
jgi:hypothetical protein